MISTKKEKALMGCLIPQRNAADLRRSGRCKGAGLKIPWKLHWREKRRKTYRPPEQKRRKSGESEQGISKPDEKKRNRCVPKGSIASNLQSARRARQQKRESATVRTERSRTITHSKRTTKKRSVRLKRSSKRNLEKFPLEKYPLSKQFRIALLLSHKNCESIYTACYDWIIFSLVTFLPCLSDRS